MGRVLLTGCAGFIGWKVGEHLIDSGYKVIGLDNMNRSYDPRIKKWRLSQLKGRESFIFYKLDISNFDKLQKVFEENDICAVINLAALAGVRASVKDPWAYHQTNVVGTLNLLELCKAKNVKKFILASTSSVYSGEEIPFKESYNTSRPYSPYAASKKAAEILCHTYHYLYGMDISVLRYFTVYGPAGRPDMSIFKFIKLIDEGKEIPVYGDGKQKRDFTYVNDAAEATVSSLKSHGYEIINVGSGREVELLYVISLIEEMLNKKAKINFLPRHKADIERTRADISKAKMLLNWKPKIKIEEGIERTVNWYKENEWVKSIHVSL
jgi:dTDP-glucose 4,6-dehydratase